MDFTDLGIDEKIINGLKKQKIFSPTKIQQKVIPLIIDKKDILAKSQTGSGKTLSYIIPAFMGIDIYLRSTQVIILAPTHELAVQIQKQAELLIKNSDLELKTALIIGGANIGRQIEKLKQKPQIVIGSAGRILELIKKRKIQAHTVNKIIIDEADRMFDEINIDNIKNIIKTTLKTQRQIIALSASINKNTIDVSKAIMDSPIIVKCGDEMPEKIEHYYIVCDDRDKIVLVRKIMAALKPKKVILFINNQQKTDELVEKLNFHGLKAGGIYGSAKKYDRRDTINSFIDERINILVSSDITARGMDFNNVDIVINIDMPEEPIFYQHRAGRTGRNGSEGKVISLINLKYKKWINKYEKYFDIQFKRKEMRFGELVDFKS